MRKHSCLLAGMLLSLFPRLALAQPPTPAAPPPPPPEREGSVDFAFVGTTGNSSTQTIGLGGELIFRPDPWETKLKIAYVRNQTEDELRAQSFALLLRAQRPIQPRLGVFGQYGYQRDRFAGILDRNAVEGGVVYSWVEQPPHKLAVDVDLGYANEQRVLGDSLSSATIGGGGTYRVKISDTSELSDEARLVVSLAEGSDWRFGNAIALTAKVSTIFSLKVSNTIRYLNLPVVGFKNTDAVTSIALIAKF